MTASAFTFTDRARPVVEVGVGDFHGPDGDARWDTARWDTDLWSGSEPAWVDVTCDTHFYECEYGRVETVGRFAVGTATVVVDNTTGWADPAPGDSPGVLTLRPGRQLRAGIDHTVHGVVWLFHGWIDAIVPRYDPVDPDRVQIECVDALGEVGRTKLVPQPEPVGAGETVDERIGYILDLAAWPRSRWLLDVSGDVLLGHDVGGQVADLLGQAADSAGGAVFGDRSGVIRFRGRDWQAYDPAVPPDAVIGNGGEILDVVYGASDVVFGTSDVVFGAAVSADAVCPTRWERPFDRADIATRVIVGRDPETAVQLDDTAAQLLYGIEPFERTNLLTESDVTIAGLAARILETRSVATAPRVRAVTLSAATSDGALDVQTTVDPYLPSRYRCQLAYDRGTVFDAMHFVTAVRHRVDPDEWETDISLDLAAPYETTGDAWDVAVWDTGQWGDAVAALTAELNAILERVDA